MTVFIGFYNGSGWHKLQSRALQRYWAGGSCRVGFYNCTGLVVQ